MRAVITTGDAITVQSSEKPSPASGEVLVRVHAATVTAGDNVLRTLPGIMFWGPVAKLLGVPPRKSTPGHEFAGVVEAISDGVTDFNIEDRVFGTTTGLPVGANADYVVVPVISATSVLARIPEGMSYETAAALPVGAMTALYLLRAANVQAGDSVLIYGASGSVGGYAVQIAAALGAVVTGVAGTRNLDLVRSLGANAVIDYKAEDFADREETYDVIFDAVGKTSGNQRKRALKPDGRFSTIRSDTHESSEALAFIIELVETGKIHPVIDRRYPLEEIADAYAYVASGRKTGNVVLNVINQEEMLHASA